MSRTHKNVLIHNVYDCNYWDSAIDIVVAHHLMNLCNSRFLLSGQICVAKYHMDENWYRAEVIELPGRRQVVVRYVDYGNTETVPFFKLKKIHDKFLMLPAQVCQSRKQITVCYWSLYLWYSIQWLLYGSLGRPGKWLAIKISILPVLETVSPQLLPICVSLCITSH